MNGFSIDEIFIKVTLVAPLSLGFIHIILLGLGKLSSTINKSSWFNALSRMLGYLSLCASVGLLIFSIERVLNFSKPFDKPYVLITLPIDIHIDALSLYFVLIVNAISLAATWNSIHFLSARENNGTSNNVFQHPLFFHGSVNLFHFTMLLVPVVNNLILLWIAIELTTVVSALLVGYQNKRASWEAAWKYIIITSTGVIFALLGTMFLANATSDFITRYEDNLSEFEPKYGQLLNDNSVFESNDPGKVTNVIMNWTFIRDLAVAGGFDDPGAHRFFLLSFLFIVVGYGTKAGFAPMHTWLPDGHGEAPAPISTLLSGVLLKSAFYAILRFFTLANIVIDPQFTSTVLLVIGIISLLIATPLILKPKNLFKRVLAYHSLEHMGIIAFGVGIGGLGYGLNHHLVISNNFGIDIANKNLLLTEIYLGFGGAIAIFGSLFHIMNHALTKALMFLVFGNIIRKYGELDYKGVLRKLPGLGSILILGGLTLVGMPPFSIFLSEFIIVYGGLKEILVTQKIVYSSLMIISIMIFFVSTLLIFIGLIVHLARVVLGKQDKDKKYVSRWLYRFRWKKYRKLGRRRAYVRPRLNFRVKMRKPRKYNENIPLYLLLLFVLLFGFGLLPKLSLLILASTRIVLFGY